MNDYISRQAAIDAVLHHGEIENDYTDLYHDGYCDGVYDSADVLEDLPSAQQWIPCSEMPPEEGVYLVTFNKSCLLENELPVMDAIWRDDQWQYSVLESYEHRMPKLVIEPIEELKVIAWMPLPEPYKGEEP